MIPIESIYETESDLHDLQPYLHLKSTWVVKRAREHYEQLVERIFKEHGRFVDPERRSACLRDDKYFLCLMKSTRIIILKVNVRSDRMHCYRGNR